MKNVRTKSYSKINIGLNIIRKRPDGFHNIESIFYPINLYDELELQLLESNSFEFNCNNKEIENSQNLVVKAVKALENETNYKFKVKIYLKKNIPLGAGLGGGSSNAAVVLNSINNLFNLHIEKTSLSKIAETIGSDVPYFLNPKPALVSSKGEKIDFINLEISHPILIINPGIHISTKWAYENIKPSGISNQLKKIFIEKSEDIYNWKNEIKNDFEEVVFKVYPAIAEIKTKLYETGAIFSLMAGTGSTVFGIFEDLKLAKNAKQLFEKNYFTYIHN